MRFHSPIVHLQSTTAADTLDQFRSMVSEDWAVHFLGAELAWAKGLSGKGVTIGVIDTGVIADTLPPELGSNVISHADFAQNSPDNAQDNPHGTFVVSEIFQVAPGVQIRSYKVLDDNGFGTSDAILAGIQAASTDKCDVISMSLGGPAPEPPIKAALDAYAQQGGIAVVAAGNSYPSPVEYPAEYSEACIAVAAINQAGQHASFSDEGPQVFVGAPGVGVLGLTPTGIATWSGTSMATPLISASIALGIEAGDVKDISSAKTWIQKGSQIIAGDTAPAEGHGCFSFRVLYGGKITLPQDIQTGPLPWNQAPSSSPSPAPVPSTKGVVLHQGETGALVRAMQGLLNAAGASLTLDGIFGPLTEAAVKTFQQHAGITVDGIPGPVTLSHLSSAVWGITCS